MTELDDCLTGWTIYCRPSDFPNHYAVRQWWVADPGVVVNHPIAVVCDTLDEAREQVPAGCVCFNREHEDDPVIVETWL
jgi:hypothetical protein